MAELNLGDYVSVRVVCYTATQVGINRVFGKVTNVTGTGVTQAAVLTQIDTDIAALYKAYISENASLRGFGIRNLTTRTLEVTNVTSAGVGGSTFPVLPTQVRGLVSYGTADAGPRGRGRHYIPFPSAEYQTAGGAPTNTYIGGINQIGDEWKTPMVLGAGANTLTLTWGLAIWGAGAHITPTGLRPFLTRNGRAKFATQRRSGGYGRQNSLPF
jgi:hypothetical protein